MWSGDLGNAGTARSTKETSDHACKPQHTVRHYQRADMQTTDQSLPAFPCYRGGNRCFLPFQMNPRWKRCRELNHFPEMRERQLLKTHLRLLKHTQLVQVLPSGSFFVLLIIHLCSLITINMDDNYLERQKCFLCCLLHNIRIFFLLFL